MGVVSVTAHFSANTRVPKLQSDLENITLHQRVLRATRVLPQPQRTWPNQPLPVISPISCHINTSKSDGNTFSSGNLGALGVASPPDCTGVM